MRRFHVYILANQSRRLYIGVTSALGSRLWKHRTGFYDAAYSKQFSITRLVYSEELRSITAAIKREKQLKRWPRWRKLRLIEAQNAGWRDLARDLFIDDTRHLDHDAPGEA